MLAATHAEWTKQRTVAGPGLLLLAAVVGTVALSAAASAAVSCPGAGCPADPTKTSLTGVLLGQAVIAVLAVLTVGTEYSTGMIGSTLIATPQALGRVGGKGRDPDRTGTRGWGCRCPRLFGGGRAVAA